MIVDLEGAGKVLSAGGAVVLPNPAPLTHVVTAREPHAVNLAKGRPASQPVALWTRVDAVSEVLDLDARARELARVLLVEERVTLLVPVLVVPDWLRPAHQDGWALLFGARWEPVRPLLDEHPLLYVSSANRTGHPPAATTAEASALGIPVLDLPAEPGGMRQATTTLRLHTDGRLELHRPGAQDLREISRRRNGGSGPEPRRARA